MTLPRLFNVCLFMIKIPPFIEIRIYNAYINISFFVSFVNVYAVLFLLFSVIIVLQNIIPIKNNAQSKTGIRHIAEGVVY